MHLDYIPYPATGYSSGDAAWQLTAATLVGLMSLPGLAVLYGGLVQKKWAVNTMLMAFSAFSLVLLVWALWAFNMGFGSPWIKTTVAGSRQRIPRHAENIARRRAGGTGLDPAAVRV